MDRRCEGCAFWDSRGTAARGLCRRSAPRTLICSLEGEPDVRAVWPETLDSDWCGQFTPAAVLAGRHAA